MAGSLFAELLRQHRLSHGLTQAELAERAGLSERAISDLERGIKQAPRASTMRLLVRGLALREAESAELSRAAQSNREPPAYGGVGLGADLHNLPLSTTSFVARAGELERLEQLLGESGLVTITGAGGCGKTRLALEVARAHVSVFLGGVWLVELASLADGSLVTQTIVASLAIPSAGRPPDEVLTEFLRTRQVLLVLDNCEHVIEACALQVERLLQACSGLRVLATSRERLDIPGEAVHRVAGLAFVADGATAEDVRSSEAGQLFLERASRLVPQLCLDDRAAAAVARICRRLDGIPLAIELAATAARAFSLEELSIRLDNRFRLLRAGGRTAPPRHQTLRAAFDWSYQLLDASEARLFRSLAVFAGGFDIDAVEAIHGPDALPVLLRLIDKSLVTVEWRGRGQRYRLLETVREYADEKLIDSGEAASFRDKHCDFYVELAVKGAVGVTGPDQVEWVERLETEHDNLRAALAWCQADPEGAAKEERLAGALGRFWRDRGYMGEGFEWLMHAARRRPGAVSVGRGQALEWAAIIAQHAGMAYEQQAELLRESVSILREADDPVELSQALRHLGSNLNYGPSGTPAAGTAVLEESLAVAISAGDQRDIGWALLYLALGALTRGDVPEARRLTDEAIPVLRTLDPNSILNGLQLEGRVALAQGYPARAELVFRETLDRSHEIGDRMWLSDGWLGMTGALRAQGDLAGARECLRELVSELRTASIWHLLPRVLLAVIMLEAGDGHDDLAARLLGAFEAAGRKVSGWPLEGLQLGPDRVTLRARLEHEPFAAAFAAGQRLTVDEALDEALAVDGVAAVPTA
jgi:non-specific serine/threonine protein kinase